MDNNFSDILNIFKRLDESKGTAKEGSMADAEHHKTGPKFGGYWKGTDKNPPKPGQGVGGMEEAWGGGSPAIQGPGVDDSQSPIHGEKELEEQLMAEWSRFLNEYGAYGAQPANTAQAGGVPNPAAQQQDAEALKKLTGIVGAAKNKGLLPPTASTTNSAATVAQNPALNKATGQQKQE